MNKDERKVLTEVWKLIGSLLGESAIEEVEEQIEQPTVVESVNYIDCYHVYKDGKPVETLKAWLFKPVLNTTMGQWIAKSSIKTITYLNSTSNDVVRVIFADGKEWIAQKIKWDYPLTR